MKISLEKGRSEINFPFPEDRIISTLTGREIPALDHGAVCRIIDQGIDATAPQDLGSRKIAVIIPDDTRLWARGDLYVPRIISALERCGADPERICIIIALGTHAPIPEDRFAALCGEGTSDKVAVLNSAGLDPDRLVAIGTTPAGTPMTVTKEAWEADHIIIFGGVLHHMLAGFGGGRKYILPGIAGEEAIQQNHSLAMDSSGSALTTVCQAELDNNPVSRDMAEGARIFLKDKTCCYVAVAANGQGEIFHAAAGPLEATFARGCTALDQACCSDVTDLGDFALFSAGGHRTDGQLYQSTKALFNAVSAVKEGGSLLFVAGCGEGVGNGEFQEALIRYNADPQALGRKLARDFRMPAYVAFRAMDLLARYRVFLVSDLGEDLTRRLGFGYIGDVSEVETRFQGRGYVIPYAENILPRYRPET